MRNERKERERKRDLWETMVNNKRKMSVEDRVTWNGERRRVEGRPGAKSRGPDRRSRAFLAAEPIGPANRRPAHEDSTVRSPSWAATG